MTDPCRAALAELVRVRDLHKSPLSDAEFVAAELAEAAAWAAAREALALPPLDADRIRQEERERAAKIAEGFATCGCNGKHGYCREDGPPKAIAAAIRAGDREAIRQRMLTEGVGAAASTADEAYQAFAAAGGEKME